MSTGSALFLLGASVFAGAINSVAGGGTLLSFPAAIAAGLPPIVANATNAVAMVPGSFAAAWAYRRHLAGLTRTMLALAVPGVAGALLGAAILRYTPQRLFDAIVPWLVLGATAIIIMQGFLRRRGNAPPDDALVSPGVGVAAVSPSQTLSAHMRPPDDWPAVTVVAPGPRGSQRRGWWLMLSLQFLVGIYGGYFGAAMGIVMLAFLGHAPGADGRAPLTLHQINAVKNVLAVIINGAASIDFIVHGLVRAGPALLMASGAIAGGAIGGRLARRAPATKVRLLIVGIGLAMSALLAWRRYGG